MCQEIQLYHIHRKFFFLSLFLSISPVGAITPRVAGASTYPATLTLMVLLFSALEEAGPSCVIISDSGDNWEGIVYWECVIQWHMYSSYIIYVKKPVTVL